MSTENNTQTSVQEIDLDIDGWLGTPGADSIIVPTGEDQKTDVKKSVFSQAKSDISFLDEEDGEDEDGNKKAPSAEKTAAVVKDILDDFADDKDDFEDNDPAPASKGGRPKTEKSGLVEFFKKRIESKEMFAFDDYDEDKQTLDEYLGTLGEKDYEELWQANIDTLKQDVAAKTPQEFFEALPDELQAAAQYVINGGQDLKGMFLALAQVEEVRELNPSEENDQEAIVRQYLQAKGIADETIDDDIQTWKDLGKLEGKAKQFKPKLDEMHEEIINYQIAQQEQFRAQQEQAAQFYIQNVFEALRPGEINGIKLDRKTQSLLYNGLTSADFKSRSGQNTTMLGHLLEKYQYTEPNYPLIAEALWLLSNPDEYRDNLKKQGRNNAVEQTARQLKTEQSKKTSSSSSFDNETQPSSRKIARNTNIFKR
jgi:uncharacterized protein YggL (DUF469 family)